MPRPRLRALLIDLSGTLHIDKEQSPCAVEALRRIREARIPIRFCSNTSKESTQDLRDKLINIGFEVNDGELWTSLGALSDVVKARKLKNPYFFLSRSAMKEFPAHTYTGDTPSGSHTDYDSVVIGLAPELFTYDRLTTAFRVLISNSSAPLIATHKARYIRTPDGELSLGPGPFVAALEDAIGDNERAEIIGKPSRAFYERVLSSLSEKPLGKESTKWDNVAIIGDDVQADLGGGASEVGLWRVLVKTGKYRPADEYRMGINPPDEVHESFAAFVDSLLEGWEDR